MKFLRVVSLLIFAICLSACEPQSHHHKHHAKVDQSTHVKEYVQHEQDNSLLYWYILYSTMTDNTTRHYYYYSSTTPVTNFDSITPTRVVGNDLPSDVKSAVDQSEQVHEYNLTEAQEPNVVEQDQAAFEETYSEYENTQNEIDSNTDSAGGDSVDTSSGGDSGGGDSGSSGGDSGGGGGGSD